MADLHDLFNSPPRPPPPRSVHSLSPSTPARATRPNENPLFFSPGLSPGYEPGGRETPGIGSSAQNVYVSERSPSPPAGPRMIRVGEQREQDATNGIVRIRHAVNILPADDSDFGGNGSGTFAERAAGATGGGRGGGWNNGVFVNNSVIHDPLAGIGGDDGDDDEEGDAVGKKRVIAKVDADRLLSENGIPALCRAAKKFKPRGKGREADDLRQVLNMYQMWAHGMFPKGDFAHTMHRTETVCRSRRMESALSGFKDAFNPRPPTSPREFSNSPRASPSRSRSRSLSPSGSPSRARSTSPNSNSNPFLVPTNTTTAHLNEREPLFDPPDLEDDPDDGPEMEYLLAREAEMIMEAEAAAAAERVDAEAEAKADARIGAGIGAMEGEEDEFGGLYD
ncbi:hypothetical protein AYX14_02134 [Cryptococcus neoformans]|nr:hypothetical protein AYX15_01736 [Cryptococcus neoformans var. grubii]OWZ72402.1 hypothetical protein AYX14_02134 [Cryptococcus neoformans var. grubii]